MFTRLLTSSALGVGGLLGAIAVVAAPGVAWDGVVCGTFMGVLGWRWVRETATGDAASKARAGWRAGVMVGAGVTGGWIALTGLVVVLGSVSGPALLLLMITTSVWWWRRSESGAALRVNPWRAARDRLLRAAQRADPPRRARVPRRAPAPLVPIGPAAQMPSAVPIPGNLSTPQLCLAWQRTYFVLLDLPADAPRGDVVALRERLLDEIERRDPDGFTRWLDTGARAGSDPGRFLTGDR